MANFEKELKKVIIAEGGYVNDNDDAGGETIFGISRKHNPNWKGWVYVDDIKKNYSSPINITNSAKRNKSLIKYVSKLYKQKYWDTMNLDNIISQNIAHEMFDMAVNSGVSNAVKIMQSVLHMKETGVWTKELNDKINSYG